MRQVDMKTATEPPLAGAIITILGARRLIVVVVVFVRSVRQSVGRWSVALALVAVHSF